MTENINIAEKSLYNHPQPSEFLTLNEYIVFKDEGKRCLSLRFTNNSKLLISSFEFILTQMDASGKVIKRLKFKHNSVRIGSAATFALKKAIVISAECTDFIVSVTSFISGNYRYKLKKNQYIPFYTVKNEKINDDFQYSRATVKSRAEASSKFYGLVALLALLTILTCSLIIIFKAESNSSRADYIYAEQSDKATDELNFCREAHLGVYNVKV